MLDEKRKEYEQSGGTCFKRELAKRFIKEGVLQGYLAYIDNTVVGWCNVNNKLHYSRLSKENRPELWEDMDNDKKIKSIVCYTIAPNMRRMGIATILLDQICFDATEEDYDCVEAYPGTGETTSHSYHGPLSLYEKSGFEKCKEINGEVIVRKNL